MNTKQYDPVIGSILKDRFRVDELFSSGGMSRTYKAVDVQGNRDVLVRVLSQQKARDANAVKRFEVAANAAMKMSHHAIAPLLESGVLESVGLPYLVYEFIRGHNVRDEIASEGKIQPQRVRDIMVTIASALHHAHTRGVIHRNMKPGNILIKDTDTGELSVILTGFGIARRVPTAASNALSIVQTKKVVGSPTYMSPESFASPEVDARSDVYSFGCVMYEMLTGRPPFLGDSFLTTAARHSYAAPQAIHELAPDVPPYMESLIAGCMKKNPDERYQSMQDVHDDLERRECRFGTLKFADDAKVTADKSDAVAPKVSMAMKVGIALAVALLAGAVWFSTQHQLQPTVQHGTSHPASNTHQYVTDARRYELAGLNSLRRGKYGDAMDNFRLALESPTLHSFDANHCRIELAYTLLQRTDLNGASQTLEYAQPERDNPIYGALLYQLGALHSTTGATKESNYYDSLATHYGYDVIPTEDEVKMHIERRIRQLTQY
jgi:serine/threonine protein kinase